MKFRQVTGLDISRVKRVIDLALAEDLGQGDLTTDLLIPPGLRGSATLLSKANGILAGGEVARQVFLRIDPSLEVAIPVKDGSAIRPGEKIGTISGSVASIVKGERTALNFLQRMSGIASLTAQYVARVRDLGVMVVETRKTVPGLRLLEKYAVRMGGGYNHRFNLSDAVLIKDNHLAALRVLGISLKDAVGKAKQGAPPGTVVEVEVTTMELALEAVEAGADVVMLDNMPPAKMKEAVRLISGRAEIEASGGITLDNIREAAESSVDFISIGALTHSVRALDISIELEPDPLRVA